MVRASPVDGPRLPAPRPQGPLGVYPDSFREAGCDSLVVAGLQIGFFLFLLFFLRPLFARSPEGHLCVQVPLLCIPRGGIWSKAGRLATRYIPLRRYSRKRTIPLQWRSFRSRQPQKPATAIASADATSLPASAMKIPAKATALPAPKTISS